MNILVTLDSNYIPPLTVLLKSLMMTNPDNKFDLYVAHSSLTEEDFLKIKIYQSIMLLLSSPSFFCFSSFLGYFQPLLPFCVYIIYFRAL